MVRVVSAVTLSREWSFKVKLEGVLLVQVRNRFCVNLFVGAKNGRVEVEDCFAAFATIVEYEWLGALRGQQFGVDDVAKLYWQSKEGGCLQVGSHFCPSFL